MLTMPCIGHCGPSTGHKMYEDENHAVFVC